MEEFDWVEFFHNVKELMDNGNMVTAVDDVKLAIDEFQLNRVTLELYEDFLVSLFTFGMQRLDDLMDQGMEHMEQDDDTQEDAFAATEAAFRRSIDVFKSINLACVPGFEEEIKANKMVLDVFTALLNHKFGFGDKTAKRREVFSEFQKLFSEGNHRGTIFFINSIQLFLDFCGDENHEESIPPLLHQKFTSYTDLRDFGSKTYRTYANTLLRDCNCLLEDRWKNQAESDSEVAFKNRAYAKCLKSTLAYIEMEFNEKPISLKMWQNLRWAMNKVVRRLVTDIKYSNNRSEQTQKKEELNGYVSDLYTLFDAKDRDGAPYYDKWFCHLLRADVADKTGGKYGRNEFECHFVETAKNAVLFAFEPERVTEFFRAIKSYIKCFCILDEDFLLQIQKGYLATEHEVRQRQPFSEPLQKAIDDVDKLIKCKGCN